MRSRLRAPDAVACSQSAEYRVLYMYHMYVRLILRCSSIIQASRADERAAHSQIGYFRLQDMLSCVVWTITEVTE